MVLLLSPIVPRVCFRRAILDSRPDRREARTRGVLAPLSTVSTTPHLALIEEVAVQSVLCSLPKPVAGEVLRRLLTSTSPGALGSAARIWCQVETGDDDLKENRAAIQDSVFLRACLDTMHNATPARMRYLLGSLIPAAWRSPEGQFGFRH